MSACLWFDNQAEEAAKFYTSLFTDSEIDLRSYYTEAGQDIHQRPVGSLMGIEFRLDNQWFLGLSGGPHFKMNPSVSFIVRRQTQKEIDVLWKKLSKEGKVLMELESYPFSDYYGWVEDRFGVSWQLILSNDDQAPRPSIMPNLLFVNEQYGKAQEAMDFYQQVFKFSEKGMRQEYGPDHGEMDHALMYGDFKIGGVWMSAMDSAHSHNFNFTEGISLLVECQTQEEIDYYWDQLREGGDPKAQVCGWLKDKYGVSWQVAPRKLSILCSQEAPGLRPMMEAMMGMQKLDMQVLEDIYHQKQVS